MDVAVRTCPSCSTALTEGAVFCHVCGARTPTGAFTAPPSDASETRRRLIAAVGQDYELRGLLGAGGFAEVYLAWDRKLKREVAIKTLRSELTHADGVPDRFRREAEAIAQLRHPNIVPVYAVAELDGVAWFVMPRIDGQTLAKALDNDERWGFAEVCRILREAAVALAAAHGVGIVHRDIKPENIMLEGPERRVVLMDFGIAKSVGHATTLTGTGVVIGTPQYMSPEQAAGDTALGPLSDQYSLGLVGYRLLTGRSAFHADSLRSLMAMQASMPLTPVRDLRPDAPIALANVIERALSKEPTERFASMQGLADALDRVARDVAGEYRRGRRTVPMADRWTDAMRRTLATRKTAFAVIVTGALLAAGAVPHGVSSNVHRVVHDRSIDEYAARSLMSAAGHVADPDGSSIGWNAPLYAFLQQAVGADSADELAYDPYHVWAWKFDYRTSDPRGSRSLYFGRNGHLVADTLRLKDSLLVGGLTADSARAIADSVLRANDEDPSRLDFRRVETTTFPRYTAHSVVWRRPGLTIVRGTDTAEAVVSATIVGTRATGFTRHGVLHQRQQDSGEAFGIRIAKLAFPFLLSLIAIGAIVALVRRGTTDVLQLTTGLRISAVAPILFVAIIAIGYRPGSLSVASMSSTLTSQFPADISLWLLGAICLVAGESLWYESRPELTAGLDDLARGRVRIPELIPATLLGYAWGLGLLGAGSALIAAGRRWFGVPYPPVPIADVAFQQRFPWAAPLLPIGFAILVSATILFATGWIQRRRGMLPLLCVLIGVALVSTLASVVYPFEAVAISSLLALLPLCVVSAGFLASVIAVSVAMGIPIAIDLMWAGGEFMSSGIAALLLLLAPAVWAMRLYAVGRKA
jgi:tRNA A-37 threonylcarbamoyl transferase component Bud32